MGDGSGGGGGGHSRAGLLLFQRTGGWLPAPTPGDSQLPDIPVPSSGLWGYIRPCVQIHSGIHAHKPMCTDTQINTHICE